MMVDTMEEETQIPDDYTEMTLEFVAPPTRAKECNNFKWQVELIDDTGNIERKMVTSKDVWKLQNNKVIVHFDGDSGQPYGDSAGLLGSWLGQLSNDVHLLPIDYTDWRNVAPHIKEKAWKVIKSKFWFDDPIVREKYVLSALGSRCKDVKLRLWKEYKKPDKAATEENRPKEIPEDQWKHLVHLRFAEKWKKMQERNVRNQKLNKVPHASGRKGFGRRRHEISTKIGRTPSRAEMFIATRTKRDETFASEEAKKYAETLTQLLSQNAGTQCTSNATARLDDEYAQVFGSDPNGRVRCVGRGPTPSKMPRLSRPSIEDITNSETVVELKKQNQTLGATVKALNTIVQELLGSPGEKSDAFSAKLADILAAIPSTTSSQDISEGGGDHGTATDEHLEDH